MLDFLVPKTNSTTIKTEPHLQMKRKSDINTAADIIIPIIIAQTKCKMNLHIY